MSIKSIGQIFKLNKYPKVRDDFFSKASPIKQATTLRREGKNYEVIVSEFSQGNKKLINIIKHDDSQNPIMTVVYNKIKQFIDGRLVASKIDTDYRQPQKYWF